MDPLTKFLPYAQDIFRTDSDPKINRVHELERILAALKWVLNTGALAPGQNETISHIVTSLQMELAYYEDQILERSTQ